MATIRARYEKGVLTPLEPLDLEEGREVDVYVPVLEQLQQPAGETSTPLQDNVTPENTSDAAPSPIWEEGDIDLDDPPSNVNPTLWWIANLHKKYPGAFDNLPTDMSINIDHYAYGVPKRTAEE